MKRVEKMLPPRLAGVVSRVRQKVVDTRFDRRARIAVPVHIYQMGKVGSSSLYRSLAKQYPGMVLRSHGLTPYHHNIYIRKVYNWSVDQKRPLKIISFIREPIGRNVSAFFQNFERDTGVAYDDSDFSVDQLKEIFLSNYNHDLPLEWFDKHIRPRFGIDVYAKPFPESGVCRYAAGQIELLVIRLETDEQTKVAAVRDFVGMDDFQLRNYNIGADKDYAPLYKQFRDTVKLPAEYVERMCSSKYFQHFYPPETIASVRARWSDASE